VAVWIIRQKFTQKGRQHLASLPARMREIYAQLEQQGFSIHGVYLTMGESDLLVILESPSDDDALGVVLGANMRGMVETKSTRAFTLDEFERAATHVASRIT
jgi:uncharacterized protein with GYD domain